MHKHIKLWLFKALCVEMGHFTAEKLNLSGGQTM